MDLQVIGTGFGRTGTDSMRVALEILGFGPCHHMREVLNDEDQYKAWRSVAAGEQPDLENLLSGYRSCVDWPTASFWPELVAANPDAKVLLTWRTAESWYRSYSQTLKPSIDTGPDPDSFGKRMIRDRTFSGRHDDAEFMMAAYRAHVERVLAEVPAGRLLVYRIGDGWGPLCAHLGVDVPDVPFPRGNSTEEFKNDASINLAQPD